MFNSYIDDLQLICKGIDSDLIEKVVDKLKKNVTIFTAGNGGSFSNASHFTQDLVLTCGLKSYCLLDNTSILTALSNDYDYEDSVSILFEKLSKPQDVLFLISYSGESENLISPAIWANLHDRFVISITGNPDNPVQRCSNIAINIPTKDIRMCENIHSILLHYIIERLLEK